MRRIITQSLTIAVLAGAVHAQMPHQVAVLVNKNSQDSKKAANVFAAAHGVPGVNLIDLDLPESIVTGRAECSPDEFRTLIYEPAQKTIEERGLDEQILAWVYSVDFPIRVTTYPGDRQQMSIMGLTFTRGKVPAAEMIEKGQYLSPLFAGPAKEGGPKNPSRSFYVMAAALKDKMPLPSMMLGYIGENGTDMETVLRCIQDGVNARKSGPAHVLLIKTDDEARSAPREWQYADVKTELALRKGTAVIYTNQPPPQKNLMGVMTGAAKVKPADFGTFAPGAFGEHFTSWSAEFQKPQTKCTDWLKAGATVTAGMVTEPYNAWVKFPHARFFVHYASGCTAMESFYQSILSPVQVLLLGDPLSQIAVLLPTDIKTIGLSKEISSSIDDSFVVEAKFPAPVKIFYSALLDGRQIKNGEGNTLVELPFNEMGDGCHTVRLIAQAFLPVSPGGFKDIPVFINKKGRSLKIVDMDDTNTRQIVVKTEISGDEKPKELFLLWNGQELDRKPYTENTELTFDERMVGEGPQQMQAVAVYEDGMQVQSIPVPFTIAFNVAAE